MDHVGDGRDGIVTPGMKASSMRHCAARVA
jgi:hypothetical protein